VPRHLAARTCKAHAGYDGRDPYLTLFGPGPSFSAAGHGRAAAFRRAALGPGLPCFSCRVGPSVCEACPRCPGSGPAGFPFGLSSSGRRLRSRHSWIGGPFKILVLSRKFPGRLQTPVAQPRSLRQRISSGTQVRAAQTPVAPTLRTSASEARRKVASQEQPPHADVGTGPSPLLKVPRAPTSVAPRNFDHARVINSWYAPGRATRAPAPARLPTGAPLLPRRLLSLPR